MKQKQKNKRKTSSVEEINGRGKQGICGHRMRLEDHCPRKGGGTARVVNNMSPSVRTGRGQKLRFPRDHGGNLNGRRGEEGGSRGREEEGGRTSEEGAGGLGALGTGSVKRLGMSTDVWQDGKDWQMS